MEVDGDTIEVLEEGEEDGTEIYAEEVGIEFNDESADSFTATQPDTSSGGGPVTIYRLIKLEHAEALGISLQEGSVTTPNQKTKIITRNIIKLNRPPRKMVLAQKNDERQHFAHNPSDADRRFVCKLCNKGFRHASHLKRHINSHTGDKLYACDLCGKRFLDASTLCRHRRTHTGDRPYACKSCEKCFGTLGSLRRHITIHNQDGRPYCCLVCAKRFPDASSFRKHRRIHSGLKPFACDVCGKAFVHVGDLNGHKRVHDEVKPWECPRCGKCFSKQSNCARHSLIHDGDKEFVCHLCGVGYNFQSSLTRHVLTHRKQSESKPPRHRKVVILTEFHGGDNQSGDEQLKPSKLTLKQIKYLVRKNKIDFGRDSEGVEGGEGAMAENIVEKEGEVANDGRKEGVKGEEVAVIENIVEIEGEVANEGCKDTASHEEQKSQKSAETPARPRMRARVPRAVASKGMKDKKRSIVIKHVTNEGSNTKYIIEEA